MIDKKLTRFMSGAIDMLARFSLLNPMLSLALTHDSAHSAVRKLLFNWRGEMDQHEFRFSD